jgi:hypothetical protein
MHRVGTVLGTVKRTAATARMARISGITQIHRSTTRAFEITMLIAASTSSQAQQGITLGTAA